jgi:HSP20 family protein
MAIIKWDPFREPLFPRVWDDFFEDMDLRSISTAVDMYETDDKVVVKMEMPGIKSDEVDISITGRTLTVSAQTKEEKKEEDKKRKYYMRQLKQRQYARNIQLPAAVDTGKTEAEMDKGVLRITLPKAEEAKPKTVKVRAKK